MLEVYLMRHGETEANVRRLAQGWTDLPLTSHGIEELHTVGQSLKDIQFDCAYSSDSGRAIETLSLILMDSGNASVVPQIDSRLREWSVGDYEQKKSSELLKDVLLPCYLKLHRRPTYEEVANSLFEVDKSNLTETWYKLRSRILNGMIAAATKAEESGAKRILIVSHGFTISTFLSLTQKKSRVKQLKNGEIKLLSFHEGRFSLIPEGKNLRPTVS